MKKTDVVIIGAGAVGSAIARELSKYKLDVTVVEKNSDVGGDASKSNSAIIHTGYDAKPGTLESQLVVAANPMYDEICKDLDIPFKRIGAILPAFNDEQMEQLPAIKHKAMMNRVYDVEYKTAEELLEMEPELNPEVKGGLYIPRESIIDPFLFVIALAENAADNGVHFELATKVIGIEQKDGAVTTVKTDKGDIECKYIINAAGLFCDEIASYVGKIPYVGWFFDFLKTTPGYIVCILIPFLLLILYNLGNVIKLFRKYKKEQSDAIAAERQQIEDERAENQRMMQELLELKAQLAKQGEADLLYRDETASGDDAPCPCQDRVENDER